MASDTAGERPQADAHNRIGMAVVAALAIGLQVQATPVILGTPLRLTLSDVLSPLIGLALLWAAYRNVAARLPQWRLPRMGLWLVGLSLVMTLSLITGRLEVGAWFGWALVSKYAGWFVLLWYFLLAAWIVRNYGERARELFISLFIYVCATVGTVDIVVRGFRLINTGVPTPLKFGWARLQGFMENPNANAFLVSIALLLMLCRMGAGRPVKPWLAHAILGVFVAVLFLTASRGAWLGLGLVVGAILLTHRAALFRPLLIAVPVAMALVFAAQATPSIVRGLQHVDLPAVPGKADLTRELRIVNTARLHGTDTDTAYRLESGLEALETWWQNPILGQGLGTYLWAQGGTLDADGRLPTIHNTFLWIMAEMGTLGALVFGGFFLLSLHALRPARFGGAPDPSGFQYAGFLMLILFAGMSLTSEMLYQRHFWFFLGLALALPAAAPAAAAMPTDPSSGPGTTPQSG